MTAMGGGYQEPTGVYYSETEPMRFLRLINFANSHNQTTDSLLAKNATIFGENNLSQSAYRFKYYHYDEWQSRVASLSGQNSNIASGILDWMRGQEPIYWYYYDLGPSGNYTRRIIKNASFPYDDISTIPGGDNPINYSFPLINSSGNRLLDSASLVLPFYQSAGLIEQVQSAFSGMFANPITNSVHPLDPTLSGIAVPAISRDIALQLNNLNLKPTDFISEYGSPKTNNSGIIFPLNILTGSGFQPILDMAQQINYPREYISNFNGIIPHSTNITIPNTTCTTIKNQMFGGFPLADYWLSQIYFGFMLPSSLNIQFSGTLPTYNFTINEYDRFGHSRAAINALAYPTITTELHSIVMGDFAYGGSLTDNTILSFIFNGKQNNVSYGITTSGTNYTIAVTGCTILGSDSTLLGYNTFSRYYDPLGDANSDNSDNGQVLTTNYYIKNSLGWLYEYETGNICLDTSDGYVSGQYLSLNPSNFSLTINDVNIPTTKYSNAQYFKNFVTSATNLLPQWCFPILIGSTVTVNYRMPAINCKGYNYGIGQAISNPGTTNGTYNCSSNGGTGPSICTPENFYRASKYGFCCVTNFIGYCTNVNDPAAALQGFCNRPIRTPTDCFSAFIPKIATLFIKNSCGDTVFSTSLAGALPPSGTYNVWADVNLSTTGNVGGSLSLPDLLNSWQNLTAYLTVQTESECISLQISQDAIGNYIGCFKNYPAGQIIDVHDDPQGPRNQFLPDSNDLTIFDLINGAFCSGTVSAGDNTTGTKCVPFGYTCTDAGKTVNISSIDCNFKIGCPDGSTQNISFSLGGGSVNYPAPLPQNGCVFDMPVATGVFSIGSAPAACGWW